MTLVISDRNKLKQGKPHPPKKKAFIMRKEGVAPNMKVGKGLSLRKELD